MPVVSAFAPNFSSQARYLFDLYTGAGGVAGIEALPSHSPKVFETNWLEFKSGLTRDDDLKPIWSKALGSFANSGGGVVIWGVRAERDARTGIDAVQELVPVPDVHRFANKLKDLQPPATDPPIRGVMIQPLFLPGKEPAGFVVCLIPESDSKPHRSEWGKGEVKRFNMRIGDSTQECTVPILRQLFYPRISASVQIEVEAGDMPVNLRGGHFRNLELGGGEDISFRCAVSVRVRNTGPSSIHEPILDLECGTHCVATVERSNSTKDYEFSYFEGSARLGLVLHPRRAPETRFIFGFGSNQPDPRLFFTLYARDLLPLSAEIAYNEIVARPWTQRILPLTAAL